MMFWSDHRSQNEVLTPFVNEAKVDNFACGKSLAGHHAFTTQ